VDEDVAAQRLVEVDGDRDAVPVLARDAEVLRVEVPAGSMATASTPP
jgi:hypothetical protein